MTAVLKPKHQRLVLVAIALTALVGAGLLAAWALRNQASYFYVPSDIAANPPAAGQEIRLGGMVEAGSLKTRADGVTIDFVVGDGDARVPVTYTGILPDLFVEARGSWPMARCCRTERSRPGSFWPSTTRITCRASSRT